MEENEQNKQIDIQIQDKWFEKGFTQVPNCVLKDTDISYQARVLYAILLSYSWQKESCNPTQETIANDLGVSVRTIRTLLNELRDKGLISWKKVSMGGHNTYLIRSLAERYTESDGDSTSAQCGSTLPHNAEVHFRNWRKYTSAKEYTYNNTHSNNNNIYIYPNKEKYGEFQNVTLTKTEHDTLVSLLNGKAEDYIERLSGYKASTGHKYKSDYATIRVWARKDLEKGKTSGQRGNEAKGIGEQLAEASLREQYGENWKQEELSDSSRQLTR